VTQVSSTTATSFLVAAATAAVRSAVPGLSKDKFGPAVPAALHALTRLWDPYTAAHQDNVGDLAAALGTQLDLGSDRVELLRLAGKFHDTGKLAIPLEILGCPGPLSAQEYAVMKTHPESGYEILTQSGFPHSVALSARQHHERCDGSGYPHGLRSPLITADALVVMVADVIEAVANPRPYRPALGVEYALELVSSGRGTLYDPGVVDAALSLFDEGYQLGPAFFQPEYPVD
jgi:putative two-component system response regulator